MKKIIVALASLITVILAMSAEAAQYKIDTSNAHASIHFKIKHLGYSWVVGRFNTFAGTFNYDKDNIAAFKVNVTIDTASVDSNQATRDKHLRSDDFLAVQAHPKSTFASTSINNLGGGKYQLTGMLLLRGVTKEISIDMNIVGEGKDPWGKYRVGFLGTTTLTLQDFGIDYNLGPASTQVDLELNIEGIAQ